MTRRPHTAGAFSRRQAAGALGAAIALAVLGACSSTGPPSTEASPTGSAGSAGSAVPAVPGPAGTDPAPGPTTAAAVRSQGTPTGICGLSVLDRGLAPRVEPTGVGAERWTWAADDAAGGSDVGGSDEHGGAPDRAHGEPASSEAALVAAPAGAVFEVQDDGSVVVRGTDGVIVCGLAPLARGVGEVLAPDLLALRRPAVDGAATGDVSVWIGAVGAESATWGENEGGRSLAVVPSDWARAAGSAGVAVVWQDIERVAPSDATPGMRDQLVCHAIGAPDKASWNLEPWRPDVGLLAVLAALCNPP